ncbi:protein FAR1-RELATED SEQUENCE 5-like [Cornus florida]|uniref:protein FAR1-RELATED SEQUENCE 5-like n=1 Tax=Cornus florida TaxID=4283 RepID=UPI0028984A3B|nr:protein FAR1-RELATED SEQUENCE 5-like [Cornus florida]
MTSPETICISHDTPIVILVSVLILRLELEPEVIKWKPRYKIEFDSEEEAYDFYNAYGARINFSIRKEYGNKVNGRITSGALVCSKEGVKGTDKRDIFRKTPRAKTRTNCGARMVLRYDKTKAKQSGGKESIGYLKVDLKNYLRTRRQKELLYGEAAWLMDYFETRSCEDPSFLYSLQLDTEQMITNIFWSDCRMIIDYGQFGDVISFDTMYKVVHGNRPFAIFLGMNHHRETTVFGVALMYDETVDSFVWLFETFLKVMGEKTLKTIITDQDAAMAKILKQVTPVTKHHLCVWHLMNNTQKNLLFLFKCVEGIKKVISKLMFQIEEEDDFIREWDLLIAEYGVAGMSSTQLSESFNGQLKYYLSRQLIIPEFFTLFGRLLSDKRYKEYEAEYGLVERQLELKTKCHILRQAGKVYTKAIFQLFQERFLAALVSQAVISCSDLDNNGHYVCKVAGEDEVQRRADIGDSAMLSSQLFSAPSSYDESSTHRLGGDETHGQVNVTPTSGMAMTSGMNHPIQHRLFQY